MEIALIIVAGIVLVTIVSMAGDYLTKTKLAQTAVDPGVLGNLEKRIAQLEAHNQEQEAKILRLEGDIAFTTRLLEGKKPE